MAENRMALAGSSRAINTVRVLQYLREHGAATASDISEGTQLPPATTYRTLHAMLEEKLVAPSRKPISDTGRVPKLYSVNPAYACAICIVIEKTTITICLSDLSGSILNREKHEIRSHLKREEILLMVHTGIAALIGTPLPEHRLSKMVRTIHIAAEADVDSVSGTILQFSGLPCLDSFDITGYFERYYEVPVRLKKLLNFEAVAGIRNYHQYSFENYIFLHIGVGFGATIVINGNFYVGANGKAGELMRLKTSDGRSWEEAYGTEPLYRALIRAIADHPDSELNAIAMEMLALPPSQAETPLMLVLERAVERSCLEAVAMVKQAVLGWANTIRWLNAMYDPEVIVIGGDLTGSMPYIFNMIRESLKQDDDISVNILPAQYASSLLLEVAKGTIDTLYDTIYSAYAAPLSSKN